MRWWDRPISAHRVGDQVILWITLAVIWAGAIGLGYLVTKLVHTHLLH